MARIAEDIFSRSAFDDPGGVHDVHAIRVARHDAEIVGDDHDGDAEPPRQILHQLQDLRLDGHVERGRRLVGDQQLGIAGKADGDHHALAHAARELMRILLEAAFRIGDPDQRQQLDRARLRGFLGHAEMNEQRLHDLKPDPQNRIERRHRLLEDHRDVMTADPAHLLVVELQEIAAVEHDRAGGDFGGLGEKPHDRQRGDGLARAGFTDDRDHLTGIDGVADVLDRAHEAVGRAELDAQVLDLKNWLAGNCSR